MCVCVCVCVWEGEERELYKNCFHFHLEKEQAFKCWSNSLCWRYTATAKPLQGATMVHSRPMHKQPSSTSCPHNKHRESIHLSFTTLAPTMKLRRTAGKDLKVSELLKWKTAFDCSGKLWNDRWKIWHVSTKENQWNMLWWLQSGKHDTRSACTNMQ